MDAQYARTRVLFIKAGRLGWVVDIARDLRLSTDHDIGTIWIEKEAIASFAWEESQLSNWKTAWGAGGGPGG